VYIDTCPAPEHCVRTEAGPWEHTCMCVGVHVGITKWKEEEKERRKDYQVNGLGFVINFVAMYSKSYIALLHGLSFNISPLPSRVYTLLYIIYIYIYLFIYFFWKPPVSSTQRTFFFYEVQGATILNNYQYTLTQNIAKKWSKVFCLRLKNWSKLYLVYINKIAYQKWG
jgi:hypothetical protein